MVVRVLLWNEFMVWFISLVFVVVCVLCESVKFMFCICIWLVSWFVSLDVVVKFFDVMCIFVWLC